MTLSPRMQRILMYYALVKLLTEPRVVQRISAGGGGKVLSSLLELGVKDHDLLDGLLDDDHTQYLPHDGTRKMTGALDLDDNALLFHTSKAKITSAATATSRIDFAVGNIVQILNFAGGSYHDFKASVVHGLGFRGKDTVSVIDTRNINNSSILIRARDNDTGAWTTCATLLSASEPELGLSRAGDISHLDGKFPILDKASGNGVKVDTTTPTFGWRDLLGPIRTRGVGATDPNDAVYNGNIKAFQFSVNDECWVDYHIPHDYVKGTDIFLHFHWSHNNALVTGGTVTWGADITYAKGHNQAAFPASVNTTVVGTASTTQYQHIITEIQISASTPNASQIDTDDIEPDGVIMIRGYLSANNITVSGGGVPEPFLHFKDIHYQSTNIATKDKVPDFYT